MKNITIRLIVVGCFAEIVCLLCIESIFAQVRIPPTSVTMLASQSDDGMSAVDSDTIPQTGTTEQKVTPVQYPVTSQIHPQVPLSQQITLQPVTPQQIAPQVQPQMQTGPPLQAVLPQTMSQSVIVPDVISSVIVIPVVVPQQYVTFQPTSFTMMVSRPVQPMYDPMTMQIMQSQMMMMQQQMMPMQPQVMAQQPIPLKMLLPDGSTVSIKHYMPGQFFKNAVRAVTP